MLSKKSWDGHIGGLSIEGGRFKPSAHYDIYMYTYIYKQEDYWIHTLKTKTPLGLLVEDCF